MDKCGNTVRTASENFFSTTRSLIAQNAKAVLLTGLIYWQGRQKKKKKSANCEM
jgi:hypothetical protein